MSTDTPLSPLETAALGLVGVVVTAVVAFVPSWAPLQTTLTTALGGVVTFGFMIASAVHAHGVKTAAALAGSKPPPPAPLAPVAAPDPHPLAGAQPGPQGVVPPPA